MEDDEIIINVHKKENIPNKKKTKNKKKKKKLNKSLENKKQLNKNKVKNSKFGFVKIILIFIIIIVLTVIICSSSLFNINTITVTGNEKLSENKIISISGLQLHSNIFKFNKSKIISNIKENAYVEDVNLKRKLPNKVEINIKERIVTYMLQFADSYVYINNQGYMLEISNEKLEVPVLVGFTTDLSNITAGNRLNKEDLEKMNIVIKIYEIAKINNLANLITKIDISNEKNYTIILKSEGKTVYLGDGSDLNARMIHLITILEKTKGKKGEIFLNVDLNTQKTYFRESVN